MGCKVNFPEYEEKIYTDIACTKDIEEKIMHWSQKELSERKDAHQAKEEYEGVRNLYVCICILFYLRCFEHVNVEDHLFHFI